jgi:phosphate transport system permease protein
MNAPLRTKQMQMTRVVGEPMVWLSAMGLGIGLLMVGTLLWVIIANGVEVFWPKRIEVFTLSIDGKEETIAGEVVKQQFKASSVQGKQGVAEFQLFTGNKDLYGQGFRFIDVSAISNRTMPSDALLVERLQYGNAIGAPVRLMIKGEQSIPATDPRFRMRMGELITEVSDRRAAILALEQGDIGAINREISDLEFHLKAVTGKNAAEEKATTARIADLRASYSGLNAKAKELRALQDDDQLVIRPYGGAERTISMGEVVSATWSNELSWFGQVGTFVGHLWSFVVEKPREANTEGGIFPAIFGTFVMTILMSLAVTPFGVVTAIYLREYARQGPFVRAVRIAVNNLAGVPSIVFGVFGLGFFVYIVGGSIDSLFFNEKLPTPTFGTGGILWAALTLALMTVPVVIVATEESIAAVPRGAKEGSLALGASKWQTIQRVVLPAAVPGILTGLILAMARGAGEVAPLMLVGVVKLAPSLPLDTIYPFFHLDQKFMHLGFHIFDLGFQSPDSEAAKPMVFATTFLLIALVMMLNLGAIILRERIRRRFATSAF